MKVNPYNYSQAKRLLDIALAVPGMIALLPILYIVWVIQKILYPNQPALFIQKRTGMGGKPFNMFKFRTMIANAHSMQKKYKHLNISDGPAYKIYNDPRLTKFGQILFKTGVDEIPQLLNVIKGEMSIVGPRPLPVAEADKLTTKQKQRHLIKPGITSSWVVSGGHQLSFAKWMELDLKYIKESNIQIDIFVIVKTIWLGIATIFSAIMR
jgi:lipopolysaccharide/colanic/teichoic acid biosynthesis glycosyltransferase